MSKIHMIKGVLLTNPPASDWSRWRFQPIRCLSLYGMPAFFSTERMIHTSILQCKGCRYCILQGSMMCLGISKYKQISTHTLSLCLGWSLRPRDRCLLANHVAWWLACSQTTSWQLSCYQTPAPPGGTWAPIPQHHTQVSPPEIVLEMY